MEQASASIISSSDNGVSLPELGTTIIMVGIEIGGVGREVEWARSFF
jgi:hypothetical protein